ncbi:hypothetical protein [Streptomyces sp. SID5785]|uniref:hypothetical protein n=1 Tax=Streptomyces sp. SID5785 TaxID=2690309 RepID=UPI001926BD19|nr:hypothetical protein [Streptomyces sp. SID5785]
MSGTTVLTEKWPVLGQHGQNAAWLTVWTDLSDVHRAGSPPTAGGLAEYLLVCDREDVNPIVANRAHIAFCVRELSSRPHRRVRA